MNYLDSIIYKQQKEFAKKCDDVIKAAFIRNGINVTDIDFLKKNVYKIIKVGDDFDHYFLYYGTPQQKRIISIQKTPEVTNSYLDNKYSISVNCKYY